MIFTNETWLAITRMAAEVFRLAPSEMARLRANTTARLIVALPYIANCEDADRTATQHLTTYLLAETAENIFDHRIEDDRDVGARLERISHFSGGETMLIRRGMALLELAMVCGYERSMETDKARGVYNPLVSGAWIAESIKSRLVKEIRSIPSQTMDSIFDVERALTGRWND